MAQYKNNIRLKPDQPLFYCYFELDSPECNFQIFEAERTLVFEEYLDKISVAVNYVNQTFSLFKRDLEMRPCQL